MTYSLQHRSVVFQTCEVSSVACPASWSSLPDTLASALSSSAAIQPTDVCVPLGVLSNGATAFFKVACDQVAPSREPTASIRIRTVKSQCSPILSRRRIRRVWSRNPNQLLLLQCAAPGAAPGFVLNHRSLLLTSDITTGTIAPAAVLTNICPSGGVSLLSSQRTLQPSLVLNLPANDTG